MKKVVCLNPDFRIYKNEFQVNYLASTKETEKFSHTLPTAADAFNIDLHTLNAKDSLQNVLYLNTLSKLHDEMNRIMEGQMNYGPRFGPKFQKSIFDFSPRISPEFAVLQKQFGTPFFCYYNIRQYNKRTYSSFCLVNIAKGELIYKEEKQKAGILGKWKMERDIKQTFSLMMQQKQ